MGIPSEEEGSDRWSLDHLFLDQDAIPILMPVQHGCWAGEVSATCCHTRSFITNQRYFSNNESPIL